MNNDRKSLPKEFWSVNVSNLFERGAYYGMTAVAADHFYKNIGLDPRIIGIYLSISMLMINFLPLISTALASKYGFKKILLFSYTTLALGYISLGTGNTVLLVGLAYVIMGFGSGFEKALIAASISHSVNEKNRSFAFNVYYWVINTGAFLIPFSIMFLFTPENYGSVFFLMALFVACSFITILTTYKNPVAPDPTVPVFNAVKNLKVIANDPRFLMVLLMFSGCWFMFYTRMAIVPIYAPYFGIVSRSVIPALAIINPLTIIFTSPIWAIFMKKRKIDPIKILITGILVASFGFIILGMSLNPAVFVFGIAVLSFGELIAYPAFLTYVSNIPPEEKRSIYMGYSFLPLAIAGAFGPVTGGFLFHYFGEGLNMGAMIWTSVASIGLIAASAFMHYHRVYGDKSELTDNEKDDFIKKILKRPSLQKITATTPIILIPIFLLISSGIIYQPVPEQEPWLRGYYSTSFEGLLNEGESFFPVLDVPEDVIISGINITVTWNDEPDIWHLGRRYENTGDNFEAGINVDGRLVNAAGYTNVHGGRGRIYLKHEMNTKEYTIDNISLEIKLVRCGDYYPAIGPGLFPIEDSSNTYHVFIEVDYLIPLIEE